MSVLPAGIYATLGSTSRILERISFLTSRCEKGIRFLHHAHNTSSSSADICVTTNSNDTQKMIESLLDSNEKNNENNDTTHANQYIVIDITNLQPVHYRSTLKDVLIPKTKRNRCMCFILGGEYLTKDIPIDAWLFPDPDFFTITPMQQLLTQWALQMKMGTDTFHAIITKMNDAQDAKSRSVTVWYPQTNAITYVKDEEKEMGKDEEKDRTTPVEHKEEKDNPAHPSLPESVFQSHISELEPASSSCSSSASSSSSSHNDNDDAGENDMEWIEDDIDDTAPIAVPSQLSHSELHHDDQIKQRNKRSWCQWLSCGCNRH